MNLSHDERFYADLPLNTLGLAELMGEPGRFAPVPPDWHVVLTDVKGSTRALDDGMHHTVNLVATGSIVAALNIAHEHLSMPPVAVEKEVDYAVDTSDAKRRIDDMGARIDAVLAPQQQLDL